MPLTGHIERRYLYKYMTAKTARISLQNASLRWSETKFLNDAFDRNSSPIRYYENIEKLKMDIREKNIFSYLKRSDRFKRGVAKAHYVSNSYFDKFQKTTDYIEFCAIDLERKASILQEKVRLASNFAKVLRLFEEPDNPILWAHYANGNNGVVLEFDATPDESDYWSDAAQVRYTKKKEKLLDLNHFLDCRINGPSTSFPMLKDIIKWAFLTKSAHWKHEKEWRICDFSYDQHEEVNKEFDPDRLTGIIFGSSISISDKNSIKKAAKNRFREACFYDTYIDDDEYKINIEYSK